MPSGANINSSTGAFRWTPGFSDAGTYKLKVVASDGSLSDDEQITITVNNVNRAPELAAIGNKTVDEGQQLSFIALAKTPTVIRSPTRSLTAPAA